MPVDDIQAALDQGGTVVLEPRDYFIKDTLYIRTHSTRLLGAGWDLNTQFGTRLIYTDPSGGGAIAVGKRPGGVYDVHLAGFSLQRAPGATNHNALGIQIGDYDYRVTDCSFKNIQVMGFGYGVELRNCQSCIFECLNPVGNSVGLLDQSDSTPLHFSCCNFRANKTGVYLNGGRAFAFYSCTFEQNIDRAVVLESALDHTPEQIQDIAFYSCFVEANAKTSGSPVILVTGRGGAVARRISFYSNFFASGDAGQGIRFENASNCALFNMPDVKIYPEDQPSVVRKY